MESSGQLIKDGFVEGDGEQVCTGEETHLDSGCVLPTEAFHKGQTIVLSAAVHSDGSGEIDGAATALPAETVICDAWPDCHGFAVGMEPGGVNGKLSCSGPDPLPLPPAIVRPAFQVNKKVGP